MSGCSPAQSRKPLPDDRDIKKLNSILMKTRLFIVVAVLALASCSTPKYTYKFDYHDYNAGRKEKQAMKEVAANPGPVEIQPEMLVAEAPVVADAQTTEAQVATPAEKRSAPLTMTKSEKKQMVKELKAAVKQAVKIKKAGDVDQSTKAMDSDLKMSLVFLVISIIAGALVTVVELMWIVSLAAFIVALIFFIKWLMRQ